MNSSGESLRPMDADEIRTRAVGFVESRSGIPGESTWRSTLEADGGVDGGLLREWLGVARNTPTIAALATTCLALLVGLGWIFDNELMRGAYRGSPAVPAATAVLLVSLAIAVLLLRSPTTMGRGHVPLRNRVGRILAALTGLVSLICLVDVTGRGSAIFSSDGSAWSEPTGAALAVMAVFAFALFTLDRDAPEFRWERYLGPLLGVLLLAALLSLGYQVNSMLDPGLTQEVSYTTAFCLVLIYISFMCLRPDRGLVAFLLSQGPGPSMARYLVPTAIAIPALIGVGEYLAGRFGEEERHFGQGGGEVLVLITLLAVVAVTSQRLQGYYRRWLDASSAVAEQADVLRGMSEGVAVVRLSDSQFVLTNPQFDAMHRCPRGGMLGNHVDDIRPEDLADWEIQERDRVARELIGTGTSKYQARSICRDGSEIWSRNTASLSEHPVHGPVMIMVKSDITEERRAQMAMSEAETRFRQVFEQSPIGLCLVLPDGGFDYVNAAFEKITGYSSRELYDLTFSDITHPDDLESDLELTDQMFSGQTVGFETEKRYIRKDGEVVWIYLTTRMLQTGNGHSSRALSMVEDITERHEFSKQLQHLADHDPLTGLFNRRRFEDELARAIGKVGDREGGLAVLNIDLDNFKFINDTYGHSVGDQLIIRTAELLRERLRSTDTLARQGGDEFVLVLRDIDREGALRIAKELTERVAADVRYDGTDYSARVTASVGVAHVGPDRDISGETLMIHADVAMYEAKDAGRNGAKLFDPQEETSVSHSLDWVAKIRTALDRDEFMLYAQPLVGFAPGGRPVHELFLRMKDRDGSIISPGAFLAVAERHDLIQGIDRWVASRAIDTLAGMDGNGGRLCVNLSGRSVGDPELLRFISGELERTGADPSGLIFEVTETSAIGNIGNAQSFAAGLAELGCGFALDDFGTGFASFYYLKHIACDFVKIDGEFVRQIANDPTDRLLVQAIVGISAGMGKQTIAEQVEDQETLELLRGYGVDFVQGYHVGRPGPVEETDLNSVPDLPGGNG